MLLHKLHGVSLGFGVVVVIEIVPALIRLPARRITVILMTSVLGHIAGPPLDLFSGCGSFTLVFAHLI